MRLNFDLITDASKSERKARTRSRSERLSVDDIWFDLPDEVLDDAESKASEAEASASDLEPRFSLLTARDQFTIWVIATLGLAFCYFGNSVLQESQATAPELSAIRLNLNRATWEELQLLEGIGELTAEKIIADRKTNGPYSTIDDLQRVSGIGPKTVEKLRPFLDCED